GDEDRLAPQADRLDDLGEQLAGATHERPTGRVLGLAGPLADEHQPGVRVALAGDGVGAALAEETLAAPRDGRHHLVERLPRRRRIHQAAPGLTVRARSEEHTSELQSRSDLVCRLLLEKKNDRIIK